MSQTPPPNPTPETLEGYIPPMTTEAEILAAIDLAFDYRGDITLTLRNGTILEGYLFDRRSSGKTLADCTLRLIPTDRPEKLTVKYSDLARLQFTGRDSAAGKSWETWTKKYQERKAAGEKNIRLEPEILD